LHKAAKRGDRAIVELLIAHHVDVNVKAESGYTPLHCTAITLQCIILQNRNMTPRPPSGSQHAEVAELLLRHNAQIDPIDKDGFTPLMSTAEVGNDGVAKVLLAKGADVALRNRSGRTALHIAATSGKKDVAELLLGWGANVYTRDAYGQTPLGTALKMGHPEVAELIRKHGGKE